MAFRPLAMLCCSADGSRCLFSTRCPLPAENHGSAHTQRAHAWWHPQEHCHVSGGEPLPQRRVLACLQGPASGFAGDRRRSIPRQGQDPLAACWGGSCLSPAHSILPDQGIQTWIIVVWFLPGWLLSLPTLHPPTPPHPHPVAAGERLRRHPWSCLTDSHPCSNLTEMSAVLCLLNTAWKNTDTKEPVETGIKKKREKKHSASVCIPALVGHSQLSVTYLFFI